MQNRIRELREAAGLSQAALGAKLGVTSFTVMRWEKEYTAIPDDRLRQLAAEFGVSVVTLIPSYGETDKEPVHVA